MRKRIGIEEGEKGMRGNMVCGGKMVGEFKWCEDEMGEVMMDMEDGMNGKDGAVKYVKKDKEEVGKWRKGVKKSNGAKVNLG